MSQVKTPVINRGMERIQEILLERGEVDSMVRYNDHLRIRLKEHDFAVTPDNVFRKTKSRRPPKGFSV